MEISRRHLLAGASAASMMTNLAPGLNGAFAADTSGRDVLVVLFQRGAADWLQMLAPAGDANYIKARPNIKAPAQSNMGVGTLNGFTIANNGQGNQFSDPPGTVAGGNCYACHQLDPSEVSYGTLGPSLTGYGKARNFDPAEAKAAFAKIYDAQSVVACSIMPRFGANKVLTEQQIQDVVAYLFDRDSPVNK